MKKIFILIAGAMMMFSFTANAQGDWAGISRYAEANKQVTKKPKAVFMGDSITDGWPNANGAFFTDNNFIGRGISGQTTSHMLSRFRRDVVDHQPEYVLILAGTNDIALNNGPINLEDVFGNIVSMCEIAKANKIKPVICSVLPAARYFWRPEVTDSAEQVIKLNSWLKEYAKKNRIKYIDYHSAMKDSNNGLPQNLAQDGIHPSAEGYKIMEALVLEVIK